MEMIKKPILFTFAYLSITSVCCGASYYVSPLGSDSNIGDNSNRPFKTFVRAFSVMSAGDKLIAKDGTYDSRTQPRGFATADCNAGAPNGTSGAHVTVQAENERKAFLSTNGDRAFRVSNCTYWDIVGFHILQGDNASLREDMVQIYNSTNVTFKRNLLEQNNRGSNQNLSAILVYLGSNNIRIIENEVYGCYANCIIVKGNSSLMQGNYVNGRTARGLEWEAATRNPGAAFVIYPGSNNVVVNNIAENITYGIDIEPEGKTVGNIIKGNISFNVSGDVIAVRGNGIDKMARATLIENHVTMVRSSSKYVGFRVQSAKSTKINNITVINNGSDSPYGFLADDPGGCSPAPCGDGSPELTLTNALVKGFTGPNATGIAVRSPYNLTASHLNSYNNRSNYGLATSANTAKYVSTDPQLGKCIIWTPHGSPKHGSEAGANILYQYDSRGNPTTARDRKSTRLNS